MRRTHDDPSPSSSERGNPMRKVRATRTSAVAMLLVAVTLLLAGCGSSGGTAAAAGTSATSTPASPQPSTRPSGARGGFDAATLKKITDCLTAAGIAVPSFSPRPIRSGAPTGRPSGAPTGGPGGGQGGRPGAGPGIFGSAAAQAALKACGITLPTRRPTPAAAATS